MRAWVLHPARDFRLENRTLPSASPGAVVIRVARAGICGSDLHYYGEGGPGAFVPKAPFVLGHEFAGGGGAGGGCGGFVRGRPRCGGPYHHAGAARMPARPFESLLENADVRVREQLPPP